MNRSTERTQPLYRFENLSNSEPLASQVVYGPSLLVPQTDSPKTGFWRRQFLAEVTPRQRKFDWAFGVLLPLVCFTFDPVVFRAWDPVLTPIFPNFMVFAYVLGFTSVLAMAAWLLWRERLGWIGAWLAGLFFVGSLISGALGLILFPFSTIGIVVFGLGLLGYTPLISSIIYLRNGVRAMRGSRPFFDKRTLAHVVGLAALMSVVLPWVMNGFLN